MGLLGLNKEVVSKLVKTLGLQTAVEKVPMDLVPTIQPVMDVNPVPEIDVVKSTIRGTTGSATVFTAPVDKDFFLTHVSMNNEHDAASNVANIRLLLNLASGEATQLFLPNATGEGRSTGMSVNPKHPIKILAGSNISVTQTFGLGTSSTSVVLIGYTQDR